MSDILILNGRLIDPANQVDAPRDLLLRDGRVAAVEAPGRMASVEAAQTIDATGLIVAPGLIDVHVHLREPGQTYKETIATGTAAAAAGGYTSVVAMPNTVPVNDTVEKLQWMLDGERGSAVKLFAMPAATIGSMGERLTDFEALRRAGAVGFTDDGKPVLEDQVMRDALIAAARVEAPVSQHAEDTRLTGGCSMNAGSMAFRLGLRGMPVEAEVRIVERDIQLLRDIERAEGLRPHLHVQHVSTSRAIQAIQQAKQEGLHVTCEIAPHHFALNEEAVGDYDTHAKMNPPLRVEQDRLQMIQALVDGIADCIATDHAPHAAFEKKQEFERAPNGITGLETALGLALRVLHRDRGLPLSRIVELMSTTPASIISLAGRGSLGVGRYADVVIFDAADKWTFRAEDSRSKSRNTPFDGASMLGKVRYTLCEGRIVYQA
ncbi:dihydroorotase [Edaphobacter sp. 12200R-103]|uniref:dihydroorotase n=1 Tax=Edaphobacter sp. 12200R-103 TaxID=2703788 RepID=UPI00138B3A86|nr:dihydroorotase [Edaphobacter sp. 12200R-103]QHS53053.1 dihydroorotase [Edaphobacter sp. 12200R-103]